MCRLILLTVTKVATCYCSKCICNLSKINNMVISNIWCLKRFLDSTTRIEICQIHKHLLIHFFSQKTRNKKFKKLRIIQWWDAQAKQVEEHARNIEKLKLRIFKWKCENYINFKQEFPDGKSLLRSSSYLKKVVHFLQFLESEFCWNLPACRSHYRMIFKNIFEVPLK